MSHHHLPFNTAVLIFCALAIAAFIPNIYYFENMYANGGTPHIGKTSCAFMMIVNIIGLILSAIILTWAVIRLFTTR